MPIIRPCLPQVMILADDITLELWPSSTGLNLRTERPTMAHNLASLYIFKDQLPIYLANPNYK